MTRAIKPVLALSLLAVVAACGVDGPPNRPEPKERIQPGITITGEVGVGVVGGNTRINYSN